VIVAEPLAAVHVTVMSAVSPVASSVAVGWLTGSANVVNTDEASELSESPRSFVAMTLNV
jgi:hypothetical protein